jgi:hypothetical protein
MLTAASHIRSGFTGDAEPRHKNKKDEGMSSIYRNGRLKVEDRLSSGPVADRSLSA